MLKLSVIDHPLLEKRHTSALHNYTDCNNKMVNSFGYTSYCNLLLVVHIEAHNKINIHV